MKVIPSGEDTLTLVAEDDDDRRWFANLKNLFAPTDFSWFQGAVDCELLREMHAITEKRKTEGSV